MADWATNKAKRSIIGVEGEVVPDVDSLPLETNGWDVGTIDLARTVRVATRFQATVTDALARAILRVWEAERPSPDRELVTMVEAAARSATWSGPEHAWLTWSLTARGLKDTGLADHGAALLLGSAASPRPHTRFDAATRRALWLKPCIEVIQTDL